jgi:hypothetical protein
LWLGLGLWLWLRPDLPPINAVERCWTATVLSGVLNLMLHLVVRFTSDWFDCTALRHP